MCKSNVCQSVCFTRVSSVWPYFKSEGWDRSFPENIDNGIFIRMFSMEAYMEVEQELRLFLNLEVGGGEYRLLNCYSFFTLKMDNFLKWKFRNM
jgi:hypothetical protein